jgi:hypothetical protein
MGGAFRTRAAAGAAVRTLIFEVNQTKASPKFHATIDSLYRFHSCLNRGFLAFFSLA